MNTRTLHFLLALFWCLSLPAVPVKIVVSGNPPITDCAGVLKQVLAQKLRFLDARLDAEIYVQPVAATALAGAGGVLLSPTDFFHRLRGSLPEDPHLDAAIAVLNTSAARQNFIACVLGQNCRFITPEGSPAAEYRGHHAIVGGNLRFKPFSANRGAHPMERAFAIEPPTHVAIVIQPPERETQVHLVDWYSDWAHEASHVATLDHLLDWLRAIRRLADQGHTVHDLAVPFLDVRDGNPTIDTAFFYLLSEGIAHHTDLLVQRALQTSPEFIPSQQSIEAKLAEDIAGLRSDAPKELGLSSSVRPFRRAQEIFDSMRTTIARARAL